MSSVSDGFGSVWPVVVERFERHAPASVMARVALEHALPSEWIDKVFEAHRQRQYSRELLFSTVIELVTLVSLGLRPSLHAAARIHGELPVSMGALYDKVNRTEPAILRALVRGSAERLGPIATGWSRGPSLPGWQLRVLDGNHLPASEKRLAPLRGPPRGGAAGAHAGGVRPGQRAGQGHGVPARTRTRASVRGRTLAGLGAQPGQLWIADRQFCTRTILLGWQGAGQLHRTRAWPSSRLVATGGPWQGCGRTETGELRGSGSSVKDQPAPWRHIELMLDAPDRGGESMIRLWSNLPEQIGAAADR